MLEIFAITVFGGLAVSAIVGFFRRRRLHYVLPRLYDYSDLSQGSRTVELIILNLGRRVESNVKLVLAPSFRYTVLAASKHGLGFSEAGVLQIERLMPRSEVSLVFIAEGASKFNGSDIAELSSDESQGKPLESVQQKQATGPGAALAVIITIVAIWGLGKMVENILLPLLANSTLVSYFDDEVSNYESCAAESLISKYAENSNSMPKLEMWLNISRIWRRFSGVHAELVVKNHFPEVIEISLRPTSIAAERASDWEYDWTEPVWNQLIGPGEEKKLSVSAHIPRDFLVQSFDVEIIIATPSDRRIFGTLRIGLNGTKVTCTG